MKETRIDITNVSKLLNIMFIVMLVLKLNNIITWSWTAVFLPVTIQLVPLILFALLAILGYVKITVDHN